MANKEKISVIIDLKDKISKGIKGVQSRIKKFGETASVAANKAALGFTALSGILGVSIKNARTQQLAINKLNQSLKNTGNFSEIASLDLQKYASELQSLTIFGDEAIISAQSLIAAFGFEGKTLKKLTKATLDLASAKGMDLQAAADLVAKSVGSSTNALTRYGIEVKGAVGSTERAEMAIKNITKVFGGQAEAAAKGLGSIIQLKNLLGDLAEKIAFVLEPQIQAITHRLKSLIEFISNNDRIVRRLAIAIGVLTATLGISAIALKTFSIAVTISTTALKGLRFAFLLVSSTPIIAGITAIASGIGFIAVKSGFASKAVNIIKTRMQELGGITNILERIKLKFQETFLIAKFEAEKAMLKIKGLFSKSKNDLSNIESKHNEKINAIQLKISGLEDKRLSKKVSDNKKAQANIEEIQKESIEEQKKIIDEFGIFTQDRFSETLLRSQKSLDKFNRSVKEAFNKIKRDIETINAIYEDTLRIINDIITENMNKNSKMIVNITNKMRDFSREIIFANDQWSETARQIQKVVFELMDMNRELERKRFLEESDRYSSGGIVGYSHGGIIPGSSFSGDRVPALVNSGEMILNKAQQSNLFNAISSGQVGGGANNVNITFTGAVLGDQAQARDFAIKIDEELFKLKRNNQSVAFN